MRTDVSGNYVIIRPDVTSIQIGHRRAARESQSRGLQDPVLHGEVHRSHDQDDVASVQRAFAPAILRTIHTSADTADKLTAKG